MEKTENGFKVAKMFSEMDHLLRFSKFSLDELRLIKQSCEVVLGVTNKTIAKAEGKVESVINQNG